MRSKTVKVEGTLTVAIRMSQVTCKSSFCGEKVKEVEGIGMGADV